MNKVVTLLADLAQKPEHQTLITEIWGSPAVFIAAVNSVEELKETELAILKMQKRYTPGYIDQISGITEKQKEHLYYLLGLSHAKEIERQAQAARKAASLAESKKIQQARAEQEPKPVVLSAAGCDLDTPLQALTTSQHFQDELAQIFGSITTLRDLGNLSVQDFNVKMSQMQDGRRKETVGGWRRAISHRLHELGEKTPSEVATKASSGKREHPEKSYEKFDPREHSLVDLIRFNEYRPTILKLWNKGYEYVQQVRHLFGEYSIAELKKQPEKQWRQTLNMLSTDEQKEFITSFLVVAPEKVPEFAVEKVATPLPEVAIKTEEFKEKGEKKEMPGKQGQIQQASPEAIIHTLARKPEFAAELLKIFGTMSVQQALNLPLAEFLAKVEKIEGSRGKAAVCLWVYGQPLKKLRQQLPPEKEPAKPIKEQAAKKKVAKKKRGRKPGPKKKKKRKATAVEEVETQELIELVENIRPILAETEKESLLNQIIARLELADALEKRLAQVAEKSAELAELTSMEE